MFILINTLNLITENQVFLQNFGYNTLIGVRTDLDYGKCTASITLDIKRKLVNFLINIEEFRIIEWSVNIEYSNISRVGC